MFYVYVLKSLKNNRLYIGSTNNIKRRLKEHNSGKSKYTQSTRPFKLVYIEKYLTKSETVRHELSLKSGQGRIWLKEVLNKME